LPLPLGVAHLLDDDLLRGLRAMRPKSIGGSGSVMKSPISASALRRCAAASGICVASFSTASTTSRKRNRRISPLRRSISARMSYS
jgi:hypothetical protein